MASKRGRGPKFTSTEVLATTPPNFPLSGTFDFRNPNYDKVFTERRDRLVKLRQRPEMLGGLREYYKTHPVEFINDWGCTFDPRNPERGLPAVVPFVLFPKQVEFIEWLYARWLGREDGLAEKSRDMGVSWLCVAFAVWMWTFYEGSVVGFGSRKEEYVDQLGDPKSLFWKAREFIGRLPIEFRPVGYSERADTPYMRIMNRENGSTMVGEAGTNIGRGNRTSIYFIDEAAFLEKPESIDAALSQTSNCKISVSTPNGNGNVFYRKRMSGAIPVFTFNWRDDPRKDDEWYQKQVSTLDAVIVAQEIDLNYEGSVSNNLIDGTYVIEAQGRVALDVDAIGPWMIGVDAAHEGNDESVIHMRRGRFNSDQRVYAKLDGVALSSAVDAICADLVDAGGDIGQIVIELDGPGVSVYDQLRQGRWRDYVVGIHTGAKLKDGKHYNQRARLWGDADRYLREGGVLMSRCPELKSQLSAMRYTYRDGLLLIQSKREFKSLYKRSPDRADAFVLTFHPYNPRVREMSGKAFFAESDYDEFAF